MGKHKAKIQKTVQLGPLELKWWKRYLHWSNQPETARLIDRYLPVTELEHEAFLKSILADKSKIFFSVCHAAKKKFLGVCALKNIDLRNRKAELYICLGEEQGRGKGYGGLVVNELLNYAFDMLNLNRVYLYTPEYNRMAIRCYKKVGFVVEGRFLDDIYRDGRYFDTVRMCFLKKFRVR
jgi:RimJ/RimL family protein N-acetyltransferase